MFRYSRILIGIILCGVCLRANLGFSQTPADPSLNEIHREIADMRRDLSALLARLKTVERRLTSAGVTVLPKEEPMCPADTSGSSPTAGASDSSAPLALDGFCPVALTDTDHWNYGRPEYSAVHHGRLYRFADEKSLKAFCADPVRYTPAMNGHDVVLAQRESRFVDGHRRYGIRFRERMFLFQSDETRDAFSKAPDAFYAFAYPETAGSDEQQREEHLED